MDLHQAIRERRSIGKVKGELPPKAAIEQMLEAATWAPNHYRVEPWRFFVLSGAARERLGDLFARLEKEDANKSGEAKDPEVVERAAESARKKPLRAPVVIAVAVEAPEDPRIVAIENVEAVAAGVQNMLLTAHALGLGAIWRTGSYAYDPRVKGFLGLRPEDHLAGFIYVGYPAMDPPAASRTPASEKTVWWGDVEGEYSQARG